MRQDREFIILANGKPLMSNRMHGSEVLASLGCGHLSGADDARVLVGGLGMGFTLTATLSALPRSATVVVAELVPGVVEWNRGPLGEFAGRPLSDPRVEVVVGDVLATLRSSQARFDAVLLMWTTVPTRLRRPATYALRRHRIRPASGWRSARAVYLQTGPPCRPPVRKSRRHGRYQVEYSACAHASRREDRGTRSSWVGLSTRAAFTLVLGSRELQRQCVSAAARQSISRSSIRHTGGD